MDREVKQILEKNALVPKRLTIKNEVKIIDTEKGSFVIKRKGNNRNINSVYDYLMSRSFDYFPKKIDETNNYEVYEYINGIEEPFEQKIIDMTSLLTLLHSKTTFYKEVDFDYYKEIYESLNERIGYLYNYYTDIITIIEKNVYMSPSDYLVARNINKIYGMINYCHDNLEKWYSLVKEKKKMRVVNLHNNLNIDHYLKNEKPYFISWNKSKIDSPIYDLLIFYKNHYLDFDFSEVFSYYESRYKLYDDERLLLFIYMMLPPKIEFNERDYDLCIHHRRVFDYLYLTEDLINNYSNTKIQHNI